MKSNDNNQKISGVKEYSEKNCGENTFTVSFNKSVKACSTVYSVESFNPGFAGVNKDDKHIECPKITENEKQETHVVSITHLSTDTADAARVIAGIKKNQIDALDELENYKRLLKKRKKRLIGRLFTVLLLLFVAPVLMFLGTVIMDKNGRHDFFGYSFYVVSSESMEPEIMVNDCVIFNTVTNAEDLKLGDDIGYINSNGAVVVHRIIQIEETASGELRFRTKGINNPKADQLFVSFEQVIGIRVATLRTLGNTVIFFRSAPGIVLFISSCVLIIVGFYISFKYTENIKYVDRVDSQ